jgi:hypothetical protein
MRRLQSTIGNRDLGGLYHLNSHYEATPSTTEKLHLTSGILLTFRGSEAFRFYMVIWQAGWAGPLIIDTSSSGSGGRQLKDAVIYHIQEMTLLHIITSTFESA